MDGDMDLGLTPVPDSMAHNPQHILTTVPSLPPYMISGEPLPHVTEAPPSATQLPQPMAQYVASAPTEEIVDSLSVPNSQPQEFGVAPHHCDHDGSTTFVFTTLLVVVLVLLKFAMQAFAVYTAHNHVVSPVFGSNSMRFTQALLLVLALAFFIHVHHIL